MRSPSRSVAASSWPSLPCSSTISLRAAHGDAGPVEVVDEVVRHRLAEVVAAVQQRHERASVRQPDRRLGGGVAAADDGDAGGAALLRLLRAGRVEDADALVGVDVGDGQPAVVGARGEHDGAGAHLVSILEPDDVAVGARLEPDRAVGRRGAGAELPRLRDRPGRELGAADAGREAEIVLDPARRARLAAEPAALDDERVEPLGRSVDGRAETRRAAPDDHEVDLLARSELEPDAERPGHLAGRRIAQLRAARAGAPAAARRHEGLR